MSPQPKFLNLARYSLQKSRPTYSCLAVCFRAKKVTVLLKLISPKPLRILRLIFGNRLKYVIELEGDPVEERNFILENPYKPGFYDGYLKFTKKNIARQAMDIKGASGIVVYSGTMKQRLLERYPQEKLEDKILVRESTGVDMESFILSKALREKVRTEKGFHRQNSLPILWAGRDELAKFIGCNSSLSKQ
jgi:hypothetical protein